MIGGIRGISRREIGFYRCMSWVEYGSLVASGFNGSTVR
jgi:hypothetical protein